MKILYDHQAFTGTQYGGISRYFYELMNVYAHQNDVDFELSLKFSNNEYLTDTPFSKHIGYQPFAKDKTVNKALSLCNRLFSLSKIGIGQYDVFHPTYYHSYFLEKLGKKPLVITFHDVLSEKYGELYPVLGQGLTALKQRLLHRADAVISVSEATKKGILEYFKVEESKIKVIPLGNYLSKINHSTTPALALPKRYVLFVGNREYYKNFALFFKALIPILHKDRDLHLICAGGGDFDVQEKTAIVQAKLQEQVIYHAIYDDSTVGQLYAKAQVFVFPSLMEGFGLPILEAMSNGCPVVATAGTSFDEIAGDAALYFEAENTDAIKAAIERVVYDEVLQHKLKQKGYERVPLFPAEHTAKQTLEVYKALVKP
ncbi:MAG: glycosyltransferase family 1 protein [Spirosomataceae bacterium]